MMKGWCSFQIGHIEIFKSGTTQTAITFTSSQCCGKSDLKVLPLTIVFNIVSLLETILSPVLTIFLFLI